MNELLTYDFRRAVLPIVATSTQGDFYCIGTGFIICNRGRHALMLTAAHNLQEIERIDQPYELSHSSTPNEFRLTPLGNNALRRTYMKVLYPTSGENEVLVLIPDAYVWPNDTAVCIVQFQEHTDQSIAFESSIVIDTTLPNIATPVWAVGYSKMEVEPTTQSNGTMLSYRRQLTSRPGQITQVFSTNGPRGRTWPCFQTDIPFDSGMSGGPILKKVGDLFVACGVISSDLATEDSDFGMGSGHAAIASMLWPTMGITIEKASIEGTRTPTTLLELQRRNFIHDLGNASAHIEILPESQLRYR